MRSETMPSNSKGLLKSFKLSALFGRRGSTSAPVATSPRPRFNTAPLVGDAPNVKGATAALRTAVPQPSSASSIDDSELSVYHGSINRKATVTGTTALEALNRVQNVLLSGEREPASFLAKGRVTMERAGDYKFACRWMPHDKATAVPTSTSATEDAASQESLPPIRRSSFQRFINGMDMIRRFTNFSIGGTGSGNMSPRSLDEIRFTVEVCRVKNLPGLLVVDVRRVRGNAWAFKRLYEDCMDELAVVAAVTV